MDTNVKAIAGNWDAGFVLHKHTLSSTYLGDNEYGRPQFDTKRSDVGEAVYQLKYKSDWAQAKLLADEIKKVIVPRLGKIEMIIPMCASNPRPRQPVAEVSKELGRLLDIPVFENLLVRKPLGEGQRPLKDLSTKEEKVAVLKEAISINDMITEGKWNALLLDDLFDSGASMEAACAALKSFRKVNLVFAVSLTWK